MGSFCEKAWLLTTAIVALIGACTACAADLRVSSLVREKFVDVPAGHIYYQDSGGKGETVVFLHPASGNSLVFEYQIEPFVKAGYRFVAFDRAGFGQSTRATSGPGNVAELEQVMDALGVRKFHIVGVAGGAGTGLQYLLNRPGRVLSLVASSSFGMVQDVEYAEMFRRVGGAQLGALSADMRELAPTYRAANGEGVDRWLQLSHIGPTMPPPGSPGAATAGPSSGRGGMNLPAAVAFETLAAIRVPTLLLTGDADLYTPPAMLHLFKRHMPRAEAYVISASGHAPQWENPAEFNRRVLAFIRKH
jgi:pimeloyl-ACP methyl ester carboxylesterase